MESILFFLIVSKWNRPVVDATATTAALGSFPNHCTFLKNLGKGPPQKNGRFMVFDHTPLPPPP